MLGWGFTLPPNVGKFATLVQLASNQPAGVGVTSKKKGFVPPCRALLECLLWCWEVHLAENPTCAVSAGKIQLLKGAIKADLGRDVK